MLFQVIFIITIFFNYIHTYSVSLEPFQSTPHIKLCSLKQNCQQILLVLDTGSPDLWISDVSCSGCPRKSTRCLAKTNFKNEGESQDKGTQNKNISQNSQKQIQYGIGWVKGFQMDYKLCGIMTRILCVTTARDILHYGSDGVIGIGGNSTGKQFLLKLITHLQMPKSISFFFGNFFTQLTIGGFNNQYIKEGSNLTYFQASPQWTINVNIFRMNDLDIITSGILGLIDTGSSLLVFPQIYFTQIKQFIQQFINFKCVQEAYGIVCPCNDEYSIEMFPDLAFQLHNNDQASTTYVLKPKHYVHLNRQHCIAQIRSLKSYAVIILGLPFLRQYVTVFDFDKQTVGIIQGDRQRIRLIEQKNLIVMLLLIFSIVLLFTKISLFMINKYLKDRDPRRLII